MNTRHQQRHECRSVKADNTVDKAIKYNIDLFLLHFLHVCNVARQHLRHDRCHLCLKGPCRLHLAIIGRWQTSLKVKYRHLLSWSVEMRCYFYLLSLRVLGRGFCMADFSFLFSASSYHFLSFAVQSAFMTVLNTTEPL